MSAYLRNWHMLVLDVFVFYVFAFAGLGIEELITNLLSFLGIQPQLLQGLIVLVSLVAAFRACVYVNRRILRTPPGGSAESSGI